MQTVSKMFHNLLNGTEAGKYENIKLGNNQSPNCFFRIYKMKDLNTTIIQFTSNC